MASTILREVFSPQHTRRTMEEVLKYLAEPPKAIEARCQCDFGHGHTSFMDEMFGVRQCRDVLRVRPPYFSSPSSAPSAISAIARETVLEVPCHDANSGAVFWAGTRARATTCLLLCRCSRSIKCAILVLCCASRTHRAAVATVRVDCDIDQTVKPWVPAL
jgi:hypothetical protein